MSQVDDTQILKNIDVLLNFDHVRNDIDIRDIERQFVDSSAKHSQPEDDLQATIRGAAAELGIRPIDLGIEDDDNGNDYQQSYNRPDHVEYPHSYSQTSGGNDAYGNSSSAEAAVFQPMHFNLPPSSSYDDAADPVNSGDDLVPYTNEQVRRRRVESVLSQDPMISVSIEKESEEETKSMMLAEIDTLIQSLQEDNVDITRIPKVVQESSYSEIESVLRILRHKSNHQRSCTFAEEFIMFGAYALEDIFDGKRRFVGYSPDLTGYHNVAQVKLRRCRGDTGMLVKSVMQDLNFGPGWRLLFEFLPSLVLHSKTRRRQHNQPDVYDDDAMETAINKLRDTFG